MWLVLVALCYSIVGCNGGGGGGGDSADLTVTALEVTPADASIAMGTTLDLTATGILSDSTNRDMTASVTWSSSDPGVATISNGVATAQGVGVTTITATQGNISYETTLTVTDAVLVSIAVTPTNPRSHPPTRTSRWAPRSSSRQPEPSRTARPRTSPPQ